MREGRERNRQRSDSMAGHPRLRRRAEIPLQPGRSREERRRQDRLCLWEADDTLYFLAAYLPNEKDNFSKAERNTFKTLIKALLKVKRDEAAKGKRAKSP